VVHAIELAHALALGALLAGHVLQQLFDMLVGVAELLHQLALRRAHAVDQAANHRQLRLRGKAVEVERARDAYHFAKLVAGRVEVAVAHLVEQLAGKGRGLACGLAAEHVQVAGGDVLQRPADLGDRAAVGLDQSKRLECLLVERVGGGNKGAAAGGVLGHGSAPVPAGACRESSVPAIAATSASIAAWASAAAAARAPPACAAAPSACWRHTGSSTSRMRWWRASRSRDWSRSRASWAAPVLQLARTVSSWSRRWPRRSRGEATTPGAAPASGCASSQARAWAMRAAMASIARVVSSSSACCTALRARRPSASASACASSTPSRSRSCRASASARTSRPNRRPNRP